MTKPQTKEQSKQKDPMDNKDYKKALVGRVRKVVKKSRRKLGEDKFEKELQRTINFLTELRDRLNKSATHSSKKTAAKPQPKAPAKPPTKTAAKAPAKAAAKPAAKVSAAAHVGAKKTAKKA
jgi:hypothetical protein